MVKADACTPASILEQMKNGGFYLSQGPQILDWGMEDGCIRLKCSPCREIHVTTYPTRGSSFYAEGGAFLADISYPLKGGERYIRIECIDCNGLSAWTNPHFFD